MIKKQIQDHAAKLTHNTLTKEDLESITGGSHANISTKKDSDLKRSPQYSYPPDFTNKYGVRFYGP